MRSTIAIVLVAMLASSMAAQSNTNSGAGVAGKPGSKSGPAMTKSGPSSSNQSGTTPDQSNVKGMPGIATVPAWMCLHAGPAAAQTFDEREGPSFRMHTQSQLPKHLTQNQLPQRLTPKFYGFTA
jgi:hypothetical protein